MNVDTTVLVLLTVHAGVLVDQPRAAAGLAVSLVKIAATVR